MNRRHIYLWPLFLLLMSLATYARAGMFSFMKIYIASEIGGVVTMDGKPLAGVKVERITKADKKYTDKTVTDAQGKFHFIAITENSLKKYYEQAVIFQEIFFYYKGKKYIGWQHGKMNYKKNGETANSSSLTHMVCDLSEKPSYQDQKTHGTIFGVCNWK